MASLISFRPWNPRTWSLLPMLLSLTLFHCFIVYLQLSLSSTYYRTESIDNSTVAIYGNGAKVNQNNNKNNDSHDHNHNIGSEENLDFEPIEDLVKNFCIYYSTSLSKLFILLLLTIKFNSIINERYEMHEIFDKGNVPSVSNKSALTGNLMELIAPNHNILIQEEYHRRFGKTYGIFYGADPWILTIDVDLLYKVFVLDSYKYINHTQYRVPLMTEINRSLVQVKDDEWRKQRKILDPFFSHRQMKKDNVYDDIDKACEKFLKAISDHPVEVDKQGKGFRIIDVNYEFKKFSIEIIFRVAYGKDEGIDMTPLKKNDLIDNLHQGSYEIRQPIVWACISIGGGYLDRFLGLFVTSFSSIGYYCKYIHKILDNSLENRKRIQHKIDQNQRKMIDTLIECIKTNKLDSESIKSNLFFIFLAGFETTANTLATMFWLLAKHLKNQELLRESILIDGEKSKYLDWCIQETLRLYPAVPSAVGRILTDDLEHNGMKFFKGTTINCSIYTLHRWKDYWGDDAEKFIPERFENKSLTRQIFSFGIGPRNCLGMNLAMAELRAIITRILVKYRIEECETTPAFLPSITPNMIHMILEGKINLKFTEITSL